MTITEHTEYNNYDIDLSKMLIHSDSEDSDDGVLHYTDIGRPLIQIHDDFPHSYGGGHRGLRAQYLRENDVPSPKRVVKRERPQAWSNTPTHVTRYFDATGGERPAPVPHLCGSGHQQLAAPTPCVCLNKVTHPAHVMESPGHSEPLPIPRSHSRSPARGSAAPPRSSEVVWGGGYPDGVRGRAASPRRDFGTEDPVIARDYGRIEMPSMSHSPLGGPRRALSAGNSSKDEPRPHRAVQHPADSGAGPQKNEERAKPTKLSYDALQMIPSSSKHRHRSETSRPDGAWNTLSSNPSLSPSDADTFSDTRDQPVEYPSRKAGVQIWDRPLQTADKTKTDRGTQYMPLFHEVFGRPPLTYMDGHVADSPLHKSAIVSARAATANNSPLTAAAAFPVGKKNKDVIVKAPPANSSTLDPKKLPMELRYGQPTKHDIDMDSEELSVIMRQNRRAFKFPLPPSITDARVPPKYVFSPDRSPRSFSFIPQNLRPPK